MLEHALHIALHTYPMVLGHLCGIGRFACFGLKGVREVGGAMDHLIESA